MTSPDAISAAVDRLATALETRVPCAAVRDLIGTEDLAAAYAVQQGLVQQRLSGGATVVGRKIGATSEAVQRQLGVDQPDFGYLLDDRDVSSDDPISMERLLQPRVEAEVAFRLASDIDPADEAEITLDAVRAAERAPVDVEMSLTVNGEVRSSGNGAACLGDPLEALRWLAVQCHRFGNPLRAGQVALSGALGRFVPFASGDEVVASISGFTPLVATFKE